MADEMNPQTRAEIVETMDKESAFMLELAARAREASTFWSRVYAKSNEQVEFVNGDQWPVEIREMYNRRKLPILTINKVDKYVDQVANQYANSQFVAGVELRSERPNRIIGEANGKKYTLSDVVTELMAKAQSKSAQHYLRAYRWACEGGVGWVRVLVRDGLSGLPEIGITSINRLFQIYGDPTAMEPDGADMDYLFELELWTAPEVNKKFRVELKAGAGKFLGMPQPQLGAWLGMTTAETAEMLQVVLYTYRDPVAMKLYRDLDGSLVRKRADVALKKDSGLTLVRKFQGYEVKWKRMLDNIVLEEGTVGTGTIPYVPFYGKERHVGKGKHYAGVADQQIDSQLEVNYARSAGVEKMSRDYNSKILVPGSTATEDMRAMVDGGTEVPMILIYDDQEGKEGMAPTVLNLNQLNPDMFRMIDMATRELGEVTGITQESMGYQTNARTGEAIRARQQGSMGATATWSFNLEHSMLRAGRLILDHIPEAHGELHQLYLKGEGQPIPMEGALDDFDANDWDISVKLTPSADSAREAQRQQLESLAQSDPDAKAYLMAPIIDLMDIPNQPEVKARYLSGLPPHMVSEAERGFIANVFGEQPADPRQALEVRELEARIAKLQAEAAQINRDGGKHSHD